MTRRHGPSVAVVGGGIAGASAAYWLAHSRGCGPITLVEAEPTLAHHTTGRSAAQLIPNLGAPPIRALTLASVPFLREPPPGFAEVGLVTPRALITLAPPGEEAAAESHLGEATRLDPGARGLSAAEAVEAFPALRQAAVGAAVLEPSCDELDVAALHHGFIAGARALGTSVLRSWRLARTERSAGRWTLVADDGRRLEADLVVNAAGAWGDVVADLCGVAPMGLQPRRRTAFMTPSQWERSARWPMVVDVSHRWYAKPDGAQFLCSPGDQTPSPPCDAKPDELDVARAIAAINAATTLNIRTVASAWAGLRTFAPDESMVIGPDPGQEAFLWCVGQGGTGIQSAPGAGRLLADLGLSGEPSEFFDGVRLDLPGLTPARGCPSRAPDRPAT
ncbi:MAG: FAD-binding oxidoreductase [Microthrixaceae bacterium]